MYLTKNLILITNDNYINGIDIDNFKLIIL